jgi:hypothetical protein
MKMKYIIFALAAFALTSCEKNEVTESKVIEHNDYSSTVSQNRVILAQTLIESLNENSQLASKIITECNKEFDGDKDVLCKNLFEMTLSNSLNVKVNSILNNSSTIRKVKSSSNNSNFASSIISQDSLVQIYYYTSGCDSISNTYEGIVVVPEDVKERDGKDLLVIKKDGTTTYIRSDIDPDENYLVISRNERSNFDNSLKQVSAPKKQKSATAAAGKSMTIIKAKFTSIASKRTVESWWSGEPEVRLNILYPVMNSVTNKADEVRNSTFLYPEQWIKHGLFKNTVKWNNAKIQCPFWYSNETNYGRRLIWTEEDGKSEAKTITSNWTDKLTGITTSINTSVPATNNDVVFADSWIDYEEVGTGKTYTWSIIEFEISCQ